MAGVLHPCQTSADHTGYKATAVLYGNFARCGNQQEPVICCLCGFIAEADNWDNFDHEWRALLTKVSSDLDATACLHGTGIFQSWDISDRHALLEDLSEVLIHSALAPIGTFVYLEHFSKLSSTERTILAAEGITTPLDVMFYDFTERLIRIAHHESEKISLILERVPQSKAEPYSALFSRHLGRYLLGPHLVGLPEFKDARNSSYLQAARLLREIIFLSEKHNLSSAITFASSFVAPPALQRMAQSIWEKGRLDTPELRKMAARLKGANAKTSQERDES